MASECDATKVEIRQMVEEVAEMQQKLTEVKRANAIRECYDLADPEKTGSLTMKPFVAKLSGFAKFEVDHKMTKEGFLSIMQGVIGTGDNYSEEKQT